MKTSLTRTALFGPYELDLRSAELRKFGTRVRMGEQTFQILCLLLEARGELVTREELQAKLWAGDTFVDFDHGLNSAVQRLRDCLSDSAEKPRWVETVPRRGYRFIGQVEWPENSHSGEIAAPQPKSEHTNSSSSNGSAPSSPRQKRRGSRRCGVEWRGSQQWRSSCCLRAF
jgi:DNA-binding winged helix-turn-helix (wHTH) protein